MDLALQAFQQQLLRLTDRLTEPGSWFGVLTCLLLVVTMLLVTFSTAKTNVVGPLNL
jgi:hypothetical protein